MADYYSDLGLGVKEPLAVSARPPGWRFTGNLVVATPVVTLDDAMASGELIYLLKLPKECVPVPRLCSAVADSDPGTFLCTVGTVADPDLLSGTITVVETAVVKFVENAAFYAAGVPNQLTDQLWIVAKLDATVAATAGAKVMFEIAWLMP